MGTSDITFAILLYMECYSRLTIQFVMSESCIFKQLVIKARKNAESFLFQLTCLVKSAKIWIFLLSNNDYFTSNVAFCHSDRHFRLDYPKLDEFWNYTLTKLVLNTFMGTFNITFAIILYMECYSKLTIWFVMSWSCIFKQLTLRAKKSAKSCHFRLTCSKLKKIWIFLLAIND